MEIERNRVLESMRKYFLNKECNFSFVSFLDECAKTGDLAGMVDIVAKAMEQAVKPNIKAADVGNAFHDVNLVKDILLGRECAGKIVSVNGINATAIVNCRNANVLNKAAKIINIIKSAKLINYPHHVNIKSKGENVFMNNKGEFSLIDIKEGSVKVLNTGGYSRIVCQYSDNNNIIVNKSSNTRIEIKGNNSVIIDGGLGSKIVVRGKNNRIYSNSEGSEFHLVGDSNSLVSDGDLSKVYIIGEMNKVNCLGEKVSITKTKNLELNEIHAPNGVIKIDDWFSIFEKSSNF